MNTDYNKSIFQRLYIEIIKERNGKVEIRKKDNWYCEDWKDWIKVKYGTTWKLKLLRWWRKQLFD